MSTRRIHGSLFAKLELRLIALLIRNIPNFVQPDQLTALGMCGTGLATAGILFSNSTSWGLIAVYLGVGLNWLGDSLDGALARARHAERPYFGFLIDKFCDLTTAMLWISALGTATLLKWTTCFVILIAVLVRLFYVVRNFMTHNLHLMALGGLGQTEGRLALIVLVTYRAVCHSNHTDFQWIGWPLEVAFAFSLLFYIVLFTGAQFNTKMKKARLS